MSDLEILERINIDIVKLLEKNDSETLSSAAGLFDGEWGLLLFLFYYEEYVGGNHENALKYLEKMYEKMDTSSGNFTYCSGLSGPMWLLNHLYGQGFIDIDINEITSDFISMAINESSINLNGGNFDFLHGASGICNLLVEFASREDVKEHLSFFVEKLSEVSVKTDMGISFPTFHYYTEDMKAAEAGIDAFSLAHGTCSYQLILLKIHQKGIEPDLCRNLISGSMDFILNHENKSASPIKSLFPSYLYGSIESRISWCYGDLNVGFALWQCGKYFGKDDWKHKALDIFRHNANRNTCETTGIVDICLCHGAAGNAAMYMRIWHETQETVFLDCAQDWYKLTYEMLEFSNDENLNGVKVWKGKEEEWQYSWDFLNGSAGAGLALISKHAGKALAWDECLLIS